MPSAGKDRGLRLRGNIWYIRYCDGNGRRYQESTGSRSKGEARRLLRLREGELAQGVPVTDKVGKLRFDKGVAKVMTNYRVNKRKTLSDVETRIRLHLVPVFGRRRMNSITTDEFERYTEKRQLEGAANASIRRELSIVKRSYKLAMKARLLMHMPHIPMPGSDKDNIRTGFFEREQFERVRDYLPENLRGITTMAYLVGWRVPSELFPLRWRQVDRKAKVIRLDPGTTKNGRGRLLPYKMLPELAEVIENAWQHRKDVAKKNGELPAPENDWVFHRDGNPVKSMKGAWKSACEKAGCPEMLMHDMRRSAVRNLVRAGVSERVSMGITGHLTRDIFDRYDIVNESDLENALGRLDDEGGPILGQSAVFSGKETVESSRVM